VRRNLLAPNFWISPQARERSRAGAQLLADAVRAEVLAQPRLVGNDEADVLQMAEALHTTGLMSDAEITFLRDSLSRPRGEHTTGSDPTASLLRRRPR
jgi:hypothetical protein